jgi:hypothetical protein
MSGCDRDEPGRPRPKEVTTPDGRRALEVGDLVIPVATEEEMADPDAQFLCSRCYKVHPVRDLHVVPTFNESLGRWVGSNRCPACWKPSVQEARAYFAAHESEELAWGLFQTVLERGVSDDILRSHVAGRTAHDAVLVTLDAIERGEIHLHP